MLNICADDKNWTENIWQKIVIKMEHSSKRNAGKIPYTTDNGVFDNRFARQPSWWTNGFWTGILWLMYEGTKEEHYLKMAQETEKMLDPVLYGLDDSFYGLHHDVGFMWLLSGIANYKMTGDPLSKRKGLIAANYLASRFNPRGNYIVAWNSVEKEGWSIIDTMMNLPLLYWATEQTGYQRYKYIAMTHADKTAQNAVRSDGSVAHIMVYDKETGDLLETLAGQGYAVGSSWSRGQSWALHGFALSYGHTKEQSYLDVAKKVAHYFISALGDDYVPKLDFRSPDQPDYRDTTAGAIAASGLLEIARYVPEADKNMYIQAAVKILKALETGHCNWNPAVDSILQNGSEAYHYDKRHISIIYGDYFFIEAILKLKGMEISFW
jgi:unsaturated chondroitin disaccharide hydrolase